MNSEIKDIINQCKSDLCFITSRSSGAGGQHVNKVETRVSLRWDIENSERLTMYQKATLKTKLNNHINKEGVLVISDESSRSQLKNKENVIRKWSRLVQKAFYVRKKRKASKPSKAAIAKRVAMKKKRSDLKASRRWKPDL